MGNEANQNNERKMTSVFERFLSLWVVLCIIAGILLGKIAPAVAQYLEDWLSMSRGRRWCRFRLPSACFS
jgi:ACR3 family arsenite efflux pump ArsB